MARRNDHSDVEADTEIDVATVEIDAEIRPRRRAARSTDRFDRGVPIAPVRLPNADLAARQRPEVGARYLNYRIRRRLARGSMGLVYEAVHLHLDRPVAIKFLDPRLLADQSAVLRFLGEARSMARIDHPGITAIHDFGQDPAGNAYLVMEHLGRDCLDDRLANRAIDLRKALEIGAQIAEALAAAHRHGVVHRDLKPQNVFLVEDERLQVKLVDFGVARPATSDDRAGLRTNTGCLIGTPTYMAPEQTYSLPVSAETDIYALGCLLFEMISGRTVFAGSVADLIDAHRHHRAPRLGADRPLPEELVELVARMLDKHPSRRPRSGDEVAATLRGIAIDLGLRWADPLATTDRLERRAVDGALDRLPRLATGTDAPPRAVLPPPSRQRALAPELTPLPFHDNSGALGTPQPFYPLAAGSQANVPEELEMSRAVRVLFVALAIAVGVGLAGWLIATVAL